MLDKKNYVLDKKYILGQPQEIAPTDFKPYFISTYFRENVFSLLIFYFLKKYKQKFFNINKKIK